MIGCHDAYLESLTVESGNSNPEKSKVLSNFVLQKAMWWSFVPVNSTFR